MVLSIFITRISVVTVKLFPFRSLYLYVTIKKATYTWRPDQNYKSDFLAWLNLYSRKMKCTINIFIQYIMNIFPLCSHSVPYYIYLSYKKERKFFLIISPLYLKDSLILLTCERNFWRRHQRCLDHFCIGRLHNVSCKPRHSWQWKRCLLLHKGTGWKPGLPYANQDL